MAPSGSALALPSGSGLPSGVASGTTFVVVSGSAVATSGVLGSGSGLTVACPINQKES